MPVDRLVSISVYLFVRWYIEVKLSTVFELQAHCTVHYLKLRKYFIWISFDWIFNMNFLLQLDCSRVSFVAFFLQAIFSSFCVHEVFVCVRADIIWWQPCLLLRSRCCPLFLPTYAPFMPCQAPRINGAMLSEGHNGYVKKSSRIQVWTLGKVGV